MKGVVTRYRRNKLALITSGIIHSIPKIKYMAFGDGGVTSDGELKSPSDLRNSLFNEIQRFEVGTPQIIDATTARYVVELAENELVEVDINEVGLIDDNNKLCAIKTFVSKTKADDEKFVFTFDDEY